MGVLNFADSNSKKEMKKFFAKYHAVTNEASWDCRKSASDVICLGKTITQAQLFAQDKQQFSATPPSKAERDVYLDWFRDASLEAVKSMELDASLQLVKSHAFRESHFQEILLEALILTCPREINAHVYFEAVMPKPGTNVKGTGPNSGFADIIITVEREKKEGAIIVERNVIIVELKQSKFPGEVVGEETIYAKEEAKWNGFKKENEWGMCPQYIQGAQKLNLTDFLEQAPMKQAAIYACKFTTPCIVYGTVAAFHDADTFDDMAPYIISLSAIRIPSLLHHGEMMEKIMTTREGNHVKVVDAPEVVVVGAAAVNNSVVSVVKDDDKISKVETSEATEKDVDE